MGGKPCRKSSAGTTHCGGSDVAEQHSPPIRVELDQRSVSTVNLFCFINYIRDWVTISVFLECQSVEDNFMWTKNKESHDSFAVIIASLWYLHMYIVTKKGPCEATMMISFLTLYIYQLLYSG